MFARRSLPPAVTELLDAQRGVVSTAQLRDAGVSPDVLRRFARDWRLLARGIHWTEPGQPPLAARATAGLLIGGAGARVARHTAAALDGYADRPPEVIDVFAARPVTARPGFRFRREQPGLRLPSRPGDMPRTRPEDTVLDLARATDPVGAIGWVTRVCQRGASTPQRLLDRLTARPRVSGRAVLLPLLADIGAGATNELELAFLRAVVMAHRLPRYAGQALEPGGRSIRDGHYPQWGVVLELDGRLWHDGPGRFRDRRRDNRHALSGGITLRYGWHEVTGDSCGVAAELCAVLRSRGWSGEMRRCPRCPTARYTDHQHRAA